MTNASFDIGEAGVKKHWYGKNIPNGVTLVGYSKILDVSIDWLLTGKEVEAPQITQLKEMIDKAVVEKGFALRDLDSDIAKIMEILIDLDPKERAPLAAMVEAYVGSRGRK